MPADMVYKYGFVPGRGQGMLLLLWLIGCLGPQERRDLLRAGSGR